MSRSDRAAHSKLRTVNQRKRFLVDQCNPLAVYGDGIANRARPDIVDVAGAMKASRSWLLKNLPDCVVHRIKKMVRQDDLNCIHNKIWDKTGIAYVEGLIRGFAVLINASGLEKIPPRGRYIYVANHPHGALDALSLIYIMYVHHGDVAVLSNGPFEWIPNLAPFILSIDFYGKGSKKKALLVNEAFASDRPILIFPSGEVSIKSRQGVIEDGEWHKSFVRRAVSYQRTVVPAFIGGKNSDRFYRLSRLRHFLGIRQYIEIVLLPDETLRQCGAEIPIVIGDPIDHRSLDAIYSHADWAERIRALVYGLKAAVR